MMKKKILVWAITGLIAIGSTAAAYAATGTSGSQAPASKPEVTAPEQNQEPAGDPELTAANTKTAITENQAEQAAVAAVPGGSSKAIQLEDENGVVVYGVEIQSGADSYDVKVDANTGAVLKSDKGGDNESVAPENGGTEKETGDAAADTDNVEQENNVEETGGAED